MSSPPRHDAEALRRELLDAFEDVRPAGPFVGSARGVEVDVTLGGGVAGVRIDPARYRSRRPDDLGTAVVAAHGNARQLAIAGQRQAIVDVLEKCGVTTIKKM